MKHLGMFNLIMFQIKQFEELTVKNIMQFANFSFDVSFQEIFTSLSIGATLQIIEEECKKDVDKVNKFITEKNIDILFLPTSYFKLLIQEESFIIAISKVKQIIVAGEQLIITDKFISYLNKNDLELCNHYGPTETHVTTSIRLKKGMLSELKAIPSIGRPIDNHKIYILNEKKLLKPIGVIGEIFIGGVALSPGYLNDSELTKKKFILNPFNKDEYIYKTGDLGRWNNYGLLEYIGRNDTQVKINGYRIEIGEIEHCLMQHDYIEGAYVFVNKQVGNSLTAYIVSKHDMIVTDLIDYLNKKLPSYMIPQSFIAIDSMPLNPNGKIDKDKLLNTKGNKLETGNIFEPPRTEIEIILATVYGEILNQHKIGINENFFVLGGDSIKSIQIVSNLKKQGYSLSVSDILKYPEIKYLSKFVKIAAKANNNDRLKSEFSVLSPIQQAFFFKRTIDRHHYNQSVILTINKLISEDKIKKWS